MLPGIGSLAAVSMLLPITFYLDPTTALVMLAGVYYGAEYGGSTSSILLNLPGTPSNAITCLDGYPMAQQGRGGRRALHDHHRVVLRRHAAGSSRSTRFAPLIVRWALAFGPAEYFAIMLFGLVAAATVTQDEPGQGPRDGRRSACCSARSAPTSPAASPRFTFGCFELRDGISFIALAMGLFGVSEIILSIATSIDKPFIAEGHAALDDAQRGTRCRRSRHAARAAAAGIGGFFGALPGTGPSIATFIGYAVEKRICEATRRSSARARSRASCRPNPPTTPRSRPPSSRP